MRLKYLVCLTGIVGAYAVAEAGRQAVEVDMGNVDLHVTPDVTLHISRMRGHFVATGGAAPYLDDKRSYVVTVQEGEIALDLSSLNRLMARSMGGEKSNVEKLQVWFNEDGTLGQKGVIDAKINVPFRARAMVSATADGRIRVSTTSVRSLGVPVSPVMKLFGLKMDSLVKVAPGTGVVTDGNDLILDPARLIPAPSIRGRVAAVRIAGNRLVQTFGSGRGPAVGGLAPNHIYWRGGQLSFGKLTMTDTDLELIDRDPSDPFDFSVDDWNAQLVAGYSKTMPDRGLRVHMPDYDDLRKGTGTGSGASTGSTPAADKDGSGSGQSR
jgi:hypothetical protein